jgi:hypothetical protein
MATPPVRDRLRPRCREVDQRLRALESAPGGIIRPAGAGPVNPAGGGPVNPAGGGPLRGGGPVSCGTSPVVRAEVIVARRPEVGHRRRRIGVGHFGSRALAALVRVVARVRPLIARVIAGKSSIRVAPTPRSRSRKSIRITLRDQSIGTVRRAESTRIDRLDERMRIVRRREGAWIDRRDRRMWII